jgi:ubiquinone/menaquinone biosynthesis C-methylase UbiE
MLDQHAAFVGSIPENYDRHLGPALFEPYAADLAGRLTLDGKASLLELACGTGIVTRRLRDRFPDAKITATDLNEAMLTYAAHKFAHEDRIEWRQADMTALPFADESFDAVVCQFGLMFVPDKAAAFREARRVLRDEGTFLFSVWDSIKHNDLARVAHETIASFFERDPPDFYEVPFSLHDRDALRTQLEGAGFRDVNLETVSLPCVSPSAAEAARGLIEGNPVAAAIRERAEASPAEIERAVARALAARFGDAPVRCRMRAVICAAVRLKRLRR